MRNKWILQWSRKERESWWGSPPFPHHLPMHSIHSQVITVTCVDSRSRQLSHDALALLYFPEVWGRKPSSAQTGCFIPSAIHWCTPEWTWKMPSLSRCFSEERVHFLDAKPKSVHLKSMLPKIMAFLSSLGFYKNNVQMSLVEINKTQEFLISLE